MSSADGRLVVLSESYVYKTFEDFRPIPSIKGMTCIPKHCNNEISSIRSLLMLYLILLLLIKQRIVSISQYQIK